MRNISSLALPFSNIVVNPRPDEKNEGGTIVEIMLKEPNRNRLKLVQNGVLSLDVEGGQHW